MRYDIVIYGGTVITVNAASDIFENGLVCVKGDRLERIGPLEKDARPPEADLSIDAGGHIVLPGLVNTHSHLPMTLFRGLADDLPLDEWLRKHIFPAEAAFITPESVQTGARLAAAEMILSGTTTCCDGYFLQDYAAEAVAASGLRAILGQGVVDFPAPGVPNPEANVATAELFIKKWKDASPRIQPSIFCHSPYTCSPRTLQAAKRAADKHGVLFQIHIAETRRERDRIQAEQRTSPVRYLDRLNLLDANTLLVHCVWVEREDLFTIARRRAGVSHNPESNMKLASGIAPLPLLLEAGISVGLGTDGCASNNNLDLFQTMDMTAKLHKVAAMDPTTADAQSVLQLATRVGAQAVGLGAVTGSLEVGKKADVILVDVRQPHLTPVYHPVSPLVYAARGSDVDTVIIDGRVVLQDRKLQTIDLDAVLEEATALALRIGRKEG
jgi:5-methylthioadenosine/S-adenosylhomocysteine deaminase